MDAITMLKTDHKTVEQLFKRFEKAGDRAYREKREIVDRIIQELSVHAAVEEMLFYPVTRATVPSTEDIALESLEEHHIVKWVLAELEDMDPEHERFDAKVTVLIENVRHHVKEEEHDYFPKVRDELGRQALADLGDAMATAKETAPTHPHPRTPDAPPGNLVVGPAVAAADRVGDAVSGAAQGGTSAIGDLVATVLRRKKPRKAPKGSPAARRTATKVRATGAEVTESVIDAVREAQRSGRATVRKARKTTGTAKKRAATTAKKTTGPAKKRAATTAKKTTGTAKKTARTTKKRAVTATKRTARTATKATRPAARRTTR